MKWQGESMRYVINEGVRLAYRVLGSGAPLVLVHGWSGEGRYWDELGYVAGLAHRYRLVVPDLRGHGDSEPSTACDYGDEAFAADILAVLDDLGIAAAHVFGYSLGGWAALELMRSHPTRVSSAIIVGAHPYAQDLSPLRVFDPIAIAENWEALGAPLSNRSLSRLRHMDHQLLIDMAEDRCDSSADLHESKTPCLMLCGTEDWHYADMERFATEHPSVEFVPIHGLDHMQTWLQTETLLDAVSGFLARQA